MMFISTCISNLFDLYEILVSERIYYQQGLLEFSYALSYREQLCSHRQN